MVCFDLFLLPSCLLFWELLHCEYPIEGPFYLSLYPDMTCWVNQHILYAVFSCIALLSVSFCCFIHAIEKNKDPFYLHFPRFGVFLGKFKTLFLKFESIIQLYLRL